jgi:hypothetical protein
MKLLSRLAAAFGIEMPAYVSSSSFSVLGSALLSEGELVRALCDVHRTEYLIVNTTILAPIKDYIQLDVGGYCRTCKAFRCAKCSAVIEVMTFGKPLWTIGCGECRTPYSSQLQSD